MRLEESRSALCKGKGENFLGRGRESSTLWQEGSFATGGEKKKKKKKQRKKKKKKKKKKKGRMKFSSFPKYRITGIETSIIGSTHVRKPGRPNTLRPQKSRLFSM